MRKRTRRGDAVNVDATSSVGQHAGSRFLIEELARRELRLSDMDVLFAGCGDAVEVNEFRSVGCRMTAIDVQLHEGLRSDSEVRFVECPVEQMPFGDGSFDVILCSHVLEHVARPRAALAEIHRVLRPGGCLHVGVPNRRRLVGYVGSRETSLATKVRWNVADYRMRLKGRFKNEYGAHAGFSKGELDALLRPFFPNVEWVTVDYLQSKYPALPRVLTRGPMGLVVTPALYALAWSGK